MFLKLIFAISFRITNDNTFILKKVLQQDPRKRLIECSFFFFFFFFFFFLIVFALLR